MRPIGVVRSAAKQPSDGCWAGLISTIELYPDQFTPESTAGLEHFFSRRGCVPVRSPEAVQTGSRHPRERLDWPKVGIFAPRERPSQPHRHDHLQNRARRWTAHLGARTGRHRWHASPGHQTLHGSIRTTKSGSSAIVVKGIDGRVLPSKSQIIACKGFVAGNSICHCCFDTRERAKPNSLPRWSAGIPRETYCCVPRSMNPAIWLCRFTRSSSCKYIMCPAE